VSIRYPLVELALALLYVLLYLKYGGTVQFGFFAAYTTVFTLIAVTDLERRLILNVVTFPAMGLALVGSFFTEGMSWKSALLGGVTGYIVFFVLALVGNRLVGPGALGGGDVTLAGFIGMVTGFPLVIEALVLGVLCGGVISLLLLVTRIRSLRDPVPYGPFLIVGGWATMLWGSEILYWFLYT
jgi:leader peptidase (prepilin peptidase)/N-methyltransferase